MKRLLHLCTFAMALILLPRQPLQAQGNNADAAQQEQLAVQYLNNREYEKAGALLPGLNLA